MTSIVRERPAVRPSRRSKSSNLDPQPSTVDTPAVRHLTCVSHPHLLEAPSLAYRSSRLQSGTPRLPHTLVSHGCLTRVSRNLAFRILTPRLSLFTLLAPYSLTPDPRSPHNLAFWRSRPFALRPSPLTPHPLPLTPTPDAPGRNMIEGITTKLGNKIRPTKALTLSMLFSA